MSIQQRSLKILSGQYIHMSRFTTDLWLTDLKIDRGHWLGCISVSSLMSVKERVLIWVVSIFQCLVWPLYLKINRGFLRIRMIRCTKFDVHQAKCSQDIMPLWPLNHWQQRVLKILIGQYFYARFDPRHFDLKINRVHVIFRMYQCMKFEVCPATGSQDI
jgi:hypothetical protein